jgi:diamine N-acetyltransferase
MNAVDQEGIIRLRAIEPEDLDLLYLWENDRNIWRVSNTIVPFSKYILQKYIENSHLDIYETKQLRLIIDYIGFSKKVNSIGAIDLFDFDPYHLRAGIGILIGAEEYRNKGFAKLALDEIVKYAFEILQLHQLYANITIDNYASIQLFEKAGFVLTGKKKDWIKIPNGFLDESLYQLINNCK